VPAKERKVLFNEFCANAVEERKKVESERTERAAARLRELFQELLGVTPLQFRLFREGRSLEEVELEGDAEVTLRTAEVEQLDIKQPDELNNGGTKQEEKEEGEADDGPDTGPPAPNTGGTISAAQAPENALGDISTLKEAILDADLEIRPGGLFGPGTTISGVHNLVAADERWKECPEDVKTAVFEEVLRPLITEREEADEALQGRVEPCVQQWLARQQLDSGTVWEDVEASRRGLVCKLPERIVRAIFEEHVAELSAQQVCASPLAGS
jgi:hypothetical protein